ncbi:MAG: universal stress protein [Pseudomonadota bacterium]
MKTILVVMHNPESAARLLRPVTALARERGAHVIGLHVVESIQPHVDASMLAAGCAFEPISAEQVARAKEVQAIFAAATEGEEFVAEWRYVETDASTTADRVIETALSVDLVVMAQEQPTSEAGNRRFTLERTIKGAGRPVLVLPYAGDFEAFGAKALLGWNPTREAARAAHDAMPLLEDGSVTILTSHGAGDGGTALATAKEVALAFDRRGISAEIVDRTDGGIPVGDMLLNEAFERGCDMIVTGAFGHSKLYDFVIGAVTSHLLDAMTAPVLFSN